MSWVLPNVVQRYFLSFESSMAIIISKRQISACILACFTIIEVRWRVLNLVDRKQVHLWTLYVCFYTCSHITFTQVVLKCYRHACSRNIDSLGLLEQQRCADCSTERHLIPCAVNISLRDTEKRSYKDRKLFGLCRKGYRYK